MRIKVVGFTLMGILALLVIPGNLNSSTNEPGFYGSAKMIHKNPLGEELFSQTVHNRILNAGEVYLLNQTFQDVAGTAVADNQQMGAICISTSSAALLETLTATDFDTADGIPDNMKNCIQSLTGASIDQGAQTAAIGPLQFQCDDMNCSNGFQVNSIGICQNRSVNSTEYWECARGGDHTATNGILFASVIVTATTLNTGETVDITYTFDISSDNT